jgi:hypothetical protein
MKLERAPGALSDQPFTLETAPLRIVARGRKVPEWRQQPNGMIGEIQMSPVKAAEAEEEITLIPMGAARLRVSMFPVAVRGGDGVVWDDNPGWVSASSMSHFDQPGRVTDRDPATALRFPSAGSRPRAHWAEMRFAWPRRVDSFELVWGQVPGAGASGAPGKVRVLYLDGAAWKAVPGRQGDAASGRIAFQSVETTCLRIEFDAPAISGAALTEWRMEGLTTVR